MNTEEKVDNHHASSQGSASEELAADVFFECGDTFLKTQDDCINYQKWLENDAWGSRKRGIELYTQNLRLFAPDKYKPVWEKMPSYKPGYHRRYLVDGWLVNTNIWVELKYSEEKGTTPEKVYYDYRKIQNGVYDRKPLLYSIWGCKARDIETYQEFKMDVDALGKNVVVIIDDDLMTETSKWVKEQVAKLDALENSLQLA